MTDYDDPLVLYDDGAFYDGAASASDLFLAVVYPFDDKGRPLKLKKRKRRDDIVAAQAALP